LLVDAVIKFLYALVDNIVFKVKATPFYLLNTERKLLNYAFPIIQGCNSYNVLFIYLNKLRNPLKFEKLLKMLNFFIK